MKKKYFLTTNDKGFFLNGIDVTDQWYWFFSGLSMEQEKDCAEIFIKRYAKKILETSKNHLKE